MVLLPRLLVTEVFPTFPVLVGFALFSVGIAVVPGTLSVGIDTPGLSI
jgi:hypothetical protein